MLKKSIIAGLLLLFAAIGGYYVYTDFLRKEKINESNLSYLSSKNLIAIVSGVDLFKKAHQFFETSIVWKELRADSNLVKFENYFQEIDTLLENLDVPFNEVTIGIYSDTDQNVSYKFVAGITEENLNKLLKNQDKIYYVEGDTNILHFNFFNTSFKGYYVNEKVIASNQLELLKNIKEEESILYNEGFKKVNTNQKEDHISLALNFFKIREKIPLPNNLLFSLSDGDWGMLHFSFDEDKIAFEGLAQKEIGFNGSSGDIKNHFYFLPHNLEYFSVITGDSLLKQIKYEDLIKSDSSCNCNFWEDAMYWVDNQILHFKANFSSNNFLAFKIKDKYLFEQASFNFMKVIGSDILDSASKIYEITPTISFSNVFGIDFEPGFYGFLNEYVIFSKDKEGLKSIYLLSKSNSSLTNNTYLVNYLTRVANKDAFSRSIQKGFIVNREIHYQGVSLLEAARKTNDIIYLTYHYSTAYNIGKTTNEALWELYFEAPLNNNIYLISNHRVNEREILVQDTTNKIYLVSSAGEIKWTYQLDSKIMGSPKKIDVYRNGKFQMVFNTPSKIYMLDVLGRNLPNYPISLTSMTSPVSVFDYDNNGDYRFFVATEKGILAYDRVGVEVVGWKQPLTDYEVRNEVRHLRVGGKDYILANDAKGHIYLYSRQGEIRHTINPQYTSNYFPVDLGDNILTTRALYIKDNKLIKHFFDNKNGIVLLTSKDSIYHFIYESYKNSIDKHWYIVLNNSVKIYNKSGVILAEIPIAEGYKDIFIQYNHIYYINLQNELVVHDLLSGNEVFYKDVEGYKIDRQFDYDRLILKNGNKLQMVTNQYKKP